MICADTSVWISFFNGESRSEVVSFEQALTDGTLIMAPPVLAELLSFPKIEKADIGLVSQLPRLEIKAGYWERVGNLRKSILQKGLKARLADSLIAQSCIDSECALLAIDQDYRHFAKLGLKFI